MPVRVNIIGNYEINYNHVFVVSRHYCVMVKVVVVIGCDWVGWGVVNGCNLVFGLVGVIVKMRTKVY